MNYRAASGLDRFKDKGALLTTVDSPALGSVHLVVTHLQAGRGAGSRAARDAQVDDLIDLTAGLEGPTVLLGDFNLYEDLSTDRDSQDRLRAAGFTDSAAALGVVDPTHLGEHARLDRVFVRGARPVQAQVLPSQGMSDHCPLVVRLEAE